ncbi:hypothetical protein [Rugamonas aquatica]|uniref:Uncharacterized protein n=1 Tax=Rugamonas aquatica TaxID=2743357 RepID=A0A6A7NCA7_9BURK|nr:hypothetical protein [Rugamonas aquatica]MQA42756.1 hypothetical protein [Rugamonas aquatica]
MKTMCLAVVLGSLALSPAALAQQTDSGQEPVSVPVKANQLRIELPDAYYKMWPEDYRDLIGSYTLSNGQTLSIVGRGVNMFAYVDQDRPHKIVATTRGTFVALDKQLKVELDLKAEGGPKGWITMVVPAQNLADGQFVPEQVLYIAMR